MKAKEQVHLLAARHAYQESTELGEEPQGCDSAGPVRVATDIDDATCATCLHWYWHVEGLVAAPHVVAEFA